MPGRCINLARQGFVVFTYDMVGYNDTDQFPHGDNGPHLGGPREDLWSINTMGLQLWDSIRAVDFVSSLPDVDPATGRQCPRRSTQELSPAIHPGMIVNHRA